MEQNQVNQTQQKQLPKILYSTLTNFKRTPDPYELQQHYFERPMMLNAWTQTTSQDFDILHHDANIRKEQQNRTEQELLEKIRILEENLRAHSEILTQIHLTSGGKTMLQQQLNPTPSHQTYNPTPLPPPIQQHRHSGIDAVVEAAKAIANNSHSNAILNTMQAQGQQQQQQTTAESVYTIIADNHGQTNGEPIEIHLAEEEENVLNCSADSGRLEICLTDSKSSPNCGGDISNFNVEIKNEFEKYEKLPTKQIPLPSVPTATVTSSTMPVVKRRRISNNLQVPPTHDDTNYYFNELGALTSISTTAAPPSYVTPQPLKRNSNGNANSLLKTTNKYIQQKQEFQHQASTSSSTLKAYSHQRMETENVVMVSLGPNDTRIPSKIFENITWTSASIATRKLLTALFDRETLATHSMTGKPSPAFKGHDKPKKAPLDQRIVQDIVFAVSQRCGVTDKEVRNAITTKCADENKMLKLQTRSRALAEQNKENINQTVHI